MNLNNLWEQTRSSQGDTTHTPYQIGLKPYGIRPGAPESIYEYIHYDKCVKSLSKQTRRSKENITHKPYYIYPKQTYEVDRELQRVYVTYVQMCEKNWMRQTSGFKKDIMYVSDQICLGSFREQTTSSQDDIRVYCLLNMIQKLKNVDQELQGGYCTYSLLDTA